MNRQTTLAVIILAVSLFSSIAFALPNKMPINGRLTFSNDTDINGTANFTFKIYNNKTGSAALWQESQQSLTVRRGLFSAYLGNNTPINLSFDENYFLEIVVNGETIEPRFDFGTTGYSFASNQTLFAKDTKVLGNLTPAGSDSLLGSNSFSWLAGYFNSLIAGTLNATDIFLGGFNLTSRIVSDNATQGSRIDVLDTRQASDNTTSGNRTALLETKQSADNTTQASLIAGNNQTLSDRIDSLGSSGAASDNTTQANLITGNNNTLGGRISSLDSRQSADNTTLFNMTSSDNATQAARMATLESNNNTIGSTAAFLAIANTFSAAWNNFFAVNATQLNVTDIFLSSINLSQRLTGDNSTIGNRIGSLEAKQSADNTTLANRLSTSASDNTTLGDRVGTLETKHSSDNTTLGAKISTLQSDNATQANAVSSVDARQSSDNTTQNNWINGIDSRQTSDNATLENKITALQADNATQSDAISSLDTKQGSDNSTLSNRISTAESNNNTIAGNLTSLGARTGNLEAKQSSDNTTLSDRFGTSVSDNTTQSNLITGNNNTLTAALAQKLGITGGKVSGLFEVDSVYALNNISVNLSNALFVNSTFERVGINNRNPSSALDVSGTLTVQGINVTGRQESDNTTIGNRAGSLETKQSSDNTTLDARITTAESNNQTLFDKINLKINLSNTSASCSSTDKVTNVTIDNGKVSILCGSDQGGSSSDNTTLTNLISANNQTLANLKANLTTFNNFTSPWIWFANITADQVNVTSGLFLGDVNYITRINSNNQTIADNLTSAGGRIGSLETKQLSDNITLGGKISTLQSDNTTQNNWINGIDSRQSADNTTLSGRIDSISGGTNDNTTQSSIITGNNNTLTAALGQKLNITGGTLSSLLSISAADSANNLSLSVNGTLHVNGSGRVGINTTNPSSTFFVQGSFNVSAGISCGMITGGTDGDFCADSTGAGGAEDNTTQENKITGNNNTLLAVSGQKLNLTGGTLSSLFTIANSSLANNLSLNASGLLYVNKTGDTGYVGIFTTSPNAFLHVNGNATIAGSLFLDGFNLSARLSGDNQTLSDRMTSENTTIAANLSSAGTRVGNLESKQTSDNTTISNSISGFLTTSDNNTLTNLKANLTTFNNFTAPWNWFANITADMINVTSGFFSGGINYITRINSNNQTLSDRITSENTTIEANLGSIVSRQSGDNTTLSNRITYENTTIAANLSALANRIATQESNDVTQAALLGQKLNLTGGTLSSLFTIENSSLANNLSLNVSGLLYVNKTGDIGYIGLFNTAPKSLLDISGNATISGTVVLEGFNLSLRITSNNQTIADNMTVAGARTGNLETKQSADNQTLSNRKANVTGDVFTGDVSITTIINRTLTTARLNVTQNTTIRNTNNAGNNSAILCYDTDGACAARMYYNGTHFVIDGC